MVLKRRSHYTPDRLNTAIITWGSQMNTEGFSGIQRVRIRWVPNTIFYLNTLRSVYLVETKPVS